jgi:hypothetical protein
MLYFDQTETKGRQVGSFRQQLWTIGHFPLHVCILLLVAGLGQLTEWRKINDALNLIFNQMAALQPSSLIPADWQTYASKINDTLQFNWPGGNYTAALATLAIPSNDSDALFDAQWSIGGSVGAWVAVGFGQEIEDTGDVGMVDLFNLYQTVFIYFFTGAGLVLVCLACIFMLGKKNKTRVEYASVAVRLAVGTGLALLTTMIIPWIDDSEANSFDTFQNFFYSPWLVPTVVLAYGLGEFTVCCGRDANPYSGRARCCAHGAEQCAVRTAWIGRVNGEGLTKNMLGWKFVFRIKQFP